jgi:hypothetical protein
MSTPEPKTKEQRLKETLTIINKMKEIGLSEKEPGYITTKEKHSEWVKTGETWSGTIDFPILGRKAELVLPARADRVASMMLKAPPNARGRRQ